MRGLKCKRCGSYAINDHLHGRQEGANLDLCDVCYWRNKSERLSTALHDAINSPMGVVPESAEEFYNQEYWDE